MEELNTKIDLISRRTTSYFKYPNFSIELIPFIANFVDGKINLNDHNQYRILEKEELLGLDLAVADLSILNEFLTL